MRVKKKLYNLIKSMEKHLDKMVFNKVINLFHDSSRVHIIEDCLTLNSEDTTCGQCDRKQVCKMFSDVMRSLRPYDTMFIYHNGNIMVKVSRVLSKHCKYKRKEL